MLTRSMLSRLFDTVSPAEAMGWIAWTVQTQEIKK
jgi:hypothetical protein